MEAGRGAVEADIGGHRPFAGKGVVESIEIRALVHEAARLGLAQEF